MSHREAEMVRLLSAGLIILWLSCGLLTACGSMSSRPGVDPLPASAADLAHHRWVLKTVNGILVRLTLEGTYGRALVPELDFGEQQTVSGFAGCNRFHGQFEINEQGQFRVPQVAATRKMCPEMAMQLEQDYFDLLSQWSELRIQGEQLTLTQGDRVWVFSLFDWVQ